MKLLKKLYHAMFLPSQNAVFLCRLVIKFNKCRHKYMATIVRNKLIKKYGIHLAFNATIGSDIQLPHPNGIIIGDGVIIGKNCSIYHQVTLGKKRGNMNDERDYPIIGDNVVIFPGAKIIGKITIGNNSVIGPNSVVIKDVEPYSVYSGIPAHKIKDLTKNPNRSE